LWQEKTNTLKIQSFEDFSLSSGILRGLEDLGFESLFPIQAQAILPSLKGKDVIGQARTGTGKTAAFGVPMVERTDPKTKSVQGLVLVPTRELAVQVANNIQLFAKYTKIRVLPVYGGEPIQRQIRGLTRGIHIVVGTPGRLIDLLKRCILNLSSVKMVVLDEADRMLDMGFIDDIEYILKRTPSSRQTSLFSATIDQTVMSVCNKYMKNPEKILVSKDEIALPQIKQYYMVVNSRSKYGALLDILREKNVNRAIIFCKTRRGTSALSEKLNRKGFNVQALHAGFTQPQRDRAINSFRDGRLKILVATDVAARGLDIQGITHIINYDVPLEALVYFHRIGRTARMEQEGTAITLVGYGELSYFNDIKALTKTNIKEIPFEQDSPIQSFC
jgi:ATP-dependent RNA helicase DeaD